jgi:hypothetical protein
MYPYEIPDNSRVSVAQLNSELRHAQLELLSAHCAIHQLRLHYSAEDLARFGRRDILRKSAEAADAVREFYVAIEQRIPDTASASEPCPEPTEAKIAQAVGWLCAYLRAQREHYLRFAQPLGERQTAALMPYFSGTLLDSIRIVELEGERVAVPEFFSEVRALGFDNLPDISHMESLTFVDVIVFNEKLTERALFHGLVHVVQIEVLGLERYAELWVRGFLKTRAHFTVPLEVHAFSLTSKFPPPAPERFIVEDEVLRWAADQRY